MFRNIVAIAFLSLCSACGQSSDSDHENKESHTPSEHNHIDHNATVHGSTDEKIKSKSGHFLVTVSWEPAELRAGLDLDHVAHVAFFSSDGYHAESVNFSKFYLHMPMMGHGTDTSNQKIVLSSQAHHYHVEGVSLNMLGDAGHWKVDIEATVNGMEDTVTVDLPQVVR